VKTPYGRDFGQEFGSSGTYRIIVQGHLAESMSDCLGGMKVVSNGEAVEANRTILLGQVRDQAELRGTIETLYELHLSILSVERVLDDDAGEP
jgi:hypothetical protein